MIKGVTKDLGNEKAFSAFYSPVTVALCRKLCEKNWNVFLLKLPSRRLARPPTSLTARLEVCSTLRRSFVAALAAAASASAMVASIR